MTQYKAQSLIQHVQRGWGYLRGEFGEFIDVVPAQQQIGKYWYRGTADGVYQNLDFMRQHHPKHVLVLAGDHIYKMDYGPMIATTWRRAPTSPWAWWKCRWTRRASSACCRDRVEPGHALCRETGEPEHMPGRTDIALASMGIYVFNPELLEKLLTEDAADEHSSHDFGKNIIPKAIETLQVFAYPFRGR